jgi:monofunctional biosynthetic peptidoglycan transglycosylase
MPKVFRFLWRFILYISLFFFSSSIFFVVLYKYVNPPVTPLMMIRVVQQAWGGQHVQIKKSWVSLDNISENLVLAVVASEDNLFLEHHGFDFESIEKARAYNERQKGKKTRGASTISQQTAKNVFLWPQRSWLRKGLETYFTVLIELVWGKRRIMEIYLNVIETGKGIYGAEAIAAEAFGKSAATLTRAESAGIAATLPNPLKWNPKNPTPYIRSRQQWILWNMNNIGKVRF